MFSVPWVLCYSFLNLSIGYLAILIVIGIILGFKIIAKEIYGTPLVKAYLILSSLLIIVLDVVIVMPLLIMLKNQGAITMESLFVVYGSKSMFYAFLIDLSLAVTMAHIPAILLPIDFKKEEGKLNRGEEFYNQVLAIFEKHGALSAETAVDKKIIKDEINTINIGKIKRFFYTDLLKGPRIKTIKGEWYFNKKDQNFKYGIFISIISLMAFAGIWNFTNATIGEDIKNDLLNNIKEEVKENTKNKEYKINDKLMITMPECMTYYDEKVEKNDSINSYYYQYVSNNTSRSDLESIQIYYYENYRIYDYYNNLAAFKNEITNLVSSYDIKEQDKIEINGETVLYYVFDKLDPTRPSIGYYIIKDNSLLEIYMLFNRDNFGDKYKSLGENIIKSIKLNQ